MLIHKVKLGARPRNCRQHFNPCERLPDIQLYRMHDALALYRTVACISGHLASWLPYTEYQCLLASPNHCDDPGSSQSLCWDYGNLIECVGQDCLILHSSLVSYLVLMPTGLSWKKYIFHSLDFSFSDMKIILFN